MQKVAGQMDLMSVFNCRGRSFDVVPQVRQCSPASSAKQYDGASPSAFTSAQESGIQDDMGNLVTVVRVWD